MARSIVGSMRELAELARAWRLGNQAFKDLFEVLPKEPDAVYNKLKHQEKPTLTNTLALQECNENWARYEARKQTRTAAKEVSQRKRELEAPGAPDGARRERLKLAGKALSARRAVIRESLLRNDGLVGRVNSATVSKDAYWHKIYLTMCLGYQLLPTEIETPLPK